MDAKGYYEAALRRMWHTQYVLALAGSGAAAYGFGWRNGAGFAAGALAGLAWFRSIQAVAYNLTGAAEVSRRRHIFFVLFRFLLVLTGAYAIVNLLGANLVAPLAGLAIPVAAVLLEVIYELIYARA